MTEMTIAEIAYVHSLFGCAAGHSSVPAIDLAAAARRGGQGWPRLRPPQGLALTGPSTAGCWRGTGLHSWLALAVRRDYPGWARATSWRSVAHRLQAPPGCPILSCRAEAPARRVLAAVVSIASPGALSFAPPVRQSTSRGRAMP